MNNIEQVIDSMVREYKELESKKNKSVNDINKLRELEYNISMAELDAMFSLK